MPLANAFRNGIFLTAEFKEGFLECVLRSELVIAPFVERLKAAILRTFY